MWYSLLWTAVPSTLSKHCLKTILLELTSTSFRCQPNRESKVITEKQKGAGWIACRLFFFFSWRQKGLLYISSHVKATVYRDDLCSIDIDCFNSEYSLRCFSKDNLRCFIWCKKIYSETKSQLDATLWQKEHIMDWLHSLCWCFEYILSLFLKNSLLGLYFEVIYTYLRQIDINVFFKVLKLYQTIMTNLLLV